MLIASYHSLQLLWYFWQKLWMLLWLIVKRVLKHQRSNLSNLGKTPEAWKKSQVRYKKRESERRICYESRRDLWVMRWREQRELRKTPAEDYDNGPIKASETRALMLSTAGLWALGFGNRISNEYVLKSHGQECQQLYVSVCVCVTAHAQSVMTTGAQMDTHTLLEQVILSGCWSQYPKIISQMAHSLEL